MPIRTLLQKITNLLVKLKPCLLMSPISVSQFLPSDAKFDLVLFDEASQLVPEDAIGAIYRGKNRRCRR
jgi:superfamily I DNA and/or RNA helicase